MSVSSWLGSVPRVCRAEVILSGYISNWKRILLRPGEVLEFLVSVSRAFCAKFLAFLCSPWMSANLARTVKSAGSSGYGAAIFSTSVSAAVVKSFSIKVANKTMISLAYFSNPCGVRAALMISFQAGDVSGFSWTWAVVVFNCAESRVWMSRCTLAACWRTRIASCGFWASR
ncbi:MAG: hypothetical protein MAG431_01040 [Chloroflexi bacterium]|nr:hypothetical protein [Chloroflexota bacterium]